MAEEIKNIVFSDSPAEMSVRLSYIEKVGTLLGIMIGEDI